jgi:tRNA pseudouridine55 synthase
MLLFDKPKGWTSHDAVEALRRTLPPGTRVGHCGTLDPLATGLLIMLVGPCTRLQSRLQGWDKVYSGFIRLGVQTDTGDVMGKVLAEKAVPQLTLAQLDELLTSCQGSFEIPAPAYSAVKHQGQALYKYARRGEAVPEKLRKTTVYDWRAVSYAAPELEHRLSCASGTYVRSLAELIGQKLGCGATVSDLRRDRVGSFDVSDALTLDGLKALPSAALRSKITDSLALFEGALKAPSRWAEPPPPPCVCAASWFAATVSAGSWVFPRRTSRSAGRPSPPGASIAWP